MQQNDNQLALSTLATYRGQPLLLIFAPNENDADYQRQKRLLADDEAVHTQSKVVIFHLFADGESDMGGTQSPSELPAQLREHFQVEEDEFALLWIDETGAVKWQKEQPASLPTVSV